MLFRHHTLVTRLVCVINACDPLSIMDCTDKPCNDGRVFIVNKNQDDKIHHAACLCAGRGSE